MSDPHARPATEPHPDAVRRRDRGLRRASNATRWSFAAAAAGTTALGVTYLHLIPGGTTAPVAAPAPAQTAQPASGWTCTTTTAPTPAPAPAAARQVDDEGRTNIGEVDDRAAPAPAPQTTTTCVAPSGGPGLTAPGQPPAATQQAPQTRTGAS